MSEGRQLILDPPRWSVLVKGVVLAVLVAAWAYTYPNAQGFTFLLLAFVALQCLESIWRARAFFVFRKDTDPLIFWLAIAGCVVLLGFSAFMFYVLQAAR